MNSSARSNAVLNEKAFRFIGYGLVFLMMACIAMEIGSLIHTGMPGAPSGVMAGIMMLGVVERLYTYPRFKSLILLSREWIIAYGAQAVVILLFSRLLLSYAKGLEAFKADLLLFVRGYFVYFFSPDFVLVLFLLIPAWLLTGQFLQLLDEIGLDQTWALQEEPVPVQSDILSAHQRLVNLIFGVGTFLVILTTLTRIDIRMIVASPDGVPRVQVTRFTGGEAGALLYFVFGLALLSLSRLMSLHTHWNRLRIPVSSDNLTRQWGKYSLLFLLILAVFVSLLPAGDTYGFFPLLRTVVGFLFQVLIFLSQLILALILLLFSLPFLLLGKAPPLMNRSGPPPLPTFSGEPVAPGPENATWVLIRSVILWGGLVAILVFSLIHFVRQHGGLLNAARKLRAASWLTIVWQWLRARLKTTGELLSQAAAESWQRLTSRREGRSILARQNFLSLRALDPRRRIYFFYLAMVRRGAEQGLKRQPAQTPGEYARTLKESLDSAHEDIESMTDAFIEARYSRHDVPPAKADFVKETWARIRRALQNLSRRKPAGDS